MELPASLTLARTAVRIAAISSGFRVISAGSLSVAGMLLNMQSGLNFKDSTSKILGSLISIENTQNVTLLKTLREFFNSDCSQRATADKMHIHHKTIRYRLAEIEQQSEMDLSVHEDRTLIYLTLQIYDLTF